MSADLYEAEVLPGLKPFAEEELHRCFEERIVPLPTARDDSLAFRYRGSAARLLNLRTAVAIYRVLGFAVPRPRALLGHAHLTRLLAAIEEVRGLHPPGAFATFRFGAAGSGSAVFARLATELEAHTGLAHRPDEADLLIRVRAAALHPDGWEVLLRLSPRPLAARAWRRCDMEGALNATVAAAMVDLTQPRGTDRFLNPMCGSGTLLIERAARGPAQAIVGGDNDREALACARQNVEAAGLLDRITLRWMDAAGSGEPPAAYDAICIDPPWGQLVGAGEDLARLYHAVLVEAARVAAPDARLVIITHALRVLETVLRDVEHLWAREQSFQVYQGGLHPRITALRRQS
ncbi:MAG: class I SAM-dependent RNA methyltransferase [Anaerolineae bacterium]